MYEKHARDLETLCLCQVQGFLFQSVIEEIRVGLIQFDTLVDCFVHLLN